MQKASLTMIRCTFDGKKLVPTSAKCAVQINPSELTHGRTIKYSDMSAHGNQSTPEYDTYGNESLAFNIVFDGTGAVPAAPGDGRRAVADRVEALLGIVYKYQGSEHEPGYVRILWGTLLFDGRLESLSTQYTLFAPSGAPLRAKVDLRFAGFMSSKESALRAGRSSPDLSHVVEVKEGDTLPLLCQSIYGDDSYYPEVARFNRLVQFRKLTPGTRLHFPPLS